MTKSRNVSLRLLLQRIFKLLFKFVSFIFYTSFRSTHYKIIPLHKGKYNDPFSSRETLVILKNGARYVTTPKVVRIIPIFERLANSQGPRRKNYLFIRNFRHGNWLRPINQSPWRDGNRSRMISASKLINRFNWFNKSIDLWMQSVSVQQIYSCFFA